MQEDFHYYATYCAALLSGFCHEDSLRIAYSDQFVDCCTETFLLKVKGPLLAATTQNSAELAAAGTGVLSRQNITRIWASFHFLPYDLGASLPGNHSKKYLEKYRLICRPNGALLEETVRLAKGKGLEACGLAMHILSDTWAHAYFAGTPSLVINNATEFYEVPSGKEIVFGHNPAHPDDPEKDRYINSPNPFDEDSIMVLGHGRAGHLPDYSFFRYRFLPAWGDYEEILKDNPADYYRAFCQMIRAMKYLRGDLDTFVKGEYDEAAAEPYKERIQGILEKRQVLASKDWKALGEEISGEKIPDFDVFACEAEYLRAAEKSETSLGRFFAAAIAQKSMVTNRIFGTGSRIAGYSRTIRSVMEDVDSFARKNTGRKEG